jgi:antitoxin component of RelBE/YafQ-DinJ toxin-antitoxin module
MQKKENIQIRIDAELKEKFFAAAELKGVTPSDYIRQLMEYAALNPNPFSVDDRIDALHQAYLALVQMLFKVSYTNLDSSLFDELISSNVFECYKEFALESAHNASRGDRQRYDRTIDTYLHDKLGISEFADNDPKYKHSYPDKEIFEKARTKGQAAKK